MIDTGEKMTAGSLALEMKAPERFDDEESKPRGEEVFSVKDLAHRDYSKELKLAEEEEAKDDNADMRYLLALNYPALTLLMMESSCFGNDTDEEEKKSSESASLSSQSS